MPKVSIIVPIYNIAAYLDANLSSLAQQSYADYEVLCIDDGSTDNSGEIIERYCQKDPRFKHFTKVNGGLSDARNFGLPYAQGEYVMFIDGDDFVEKDLLEKAVSHMDEGQLDMFVFAYYQHYLYDDHIEFIPLEIKDGITDLRSDPKILAKTPNAAWNKMYRKDLFTDHDILYPYGYRHQDLGTTGKLLYYAKKVGYQNRAYYHYLIDRPDNITKQVDEKITHIIDMCDELIAFYNQHDYFLPVYEELAYLCKINLMQSLKKAMNLKDRTFAEHFIDRVFDFMEEKFPQPLKKYRVGDSPSDRIYQNRHLCKLYYRYHQRRKAQ